MERLWPPVIVDKRVKDVRLYIRTVLSEEAVARRGREGCGVESQVRELQDGVNVARCRRGGGLEAIVGWKEASRNEGGLLRCVR